jgi:hypothetical protein
MTFVSLPIKINDHITGALNPPPLFTQTPRRRERKTEEQTHLKMKDETRKEE